MGIRRNGKKWRKKEADKSSRERKGVRTKQWRIMSKRGSVREKWKMRSWLSSINKKV